MRGLYAFNRFGTRRAIASSGYGLYSDLANNGIFFSPRFLLAVRPWKENGTMMKISVGGGQLCLPLDSYWCKGLYIHAVTKSAVEESQFLWFKADLWSPEHEVPVGLRVAAA